MRKVLSVVATAVLLTSVMSTSLMADPAKGQKIYLKKFKKACGFNGSKMTAKHTQDEWETLKNDGKLVDEIKTICPNVKEVKEKYVPDLFDFFHEFGSDSGNVPAC